MGGATDAIGPGLRSPRSIPCHAGLRGHVYRSPVADVFRKAAGRNLRPRFGSTFVSRIERVGVSARAIRLSARFGLGSLDGAVHTGKRGGHVAVVAELQPPAGEDTSDPPASAMWVDTDVVPLSSANSIAMVDAPAGSCGSEEATRAAGNPLESQLVA